MTALPSELTILGIRASSGGRGSWTGTDEESGITVEVTNRIRGHGDVTYYACAYSASGVGAWTVEGPYRDTPESAVLALETLVKGLAGRCRDG